MAWLTHFFPSICCFSLRGAKSTRMNHINNGTFSIWEMFLNYIKVWTKWFKWLKVSVKVSVSTDCALALPLGVYYRLFLQIACIPMNFHKIPWWKVTSTVFNITFPSLLCCRNAKKLKAFWLNGWVERKTQKKLKFLVWRLEEGKSFGLERMDLSRWVCDMMRLRLWHCMWSLTQYRVSVDQNRVSMTHAATAIGH